MANKFLDFAEKVLEKASTPMSCNEIWEKGKEMGLVDKMQTGKTPWASLGAQMYVEVRDNNESIFEKIGKRPARFILKSKKSSLNISDIQKIENITDKKIENNTGRFHERDLHPVLSYFMYNGGELGMGASIYTKTIHHEKSSKSGYSEWVYPDLVGFYLPVDEWEDDILELNQVTDKNYFKLYSFEVKKFINRANYRESFFQAVSNSSWANEGYLVCANLLEDEDLTVELERLSRAFGIGLILLDLDDIDESAVLLNAKTKETLDWDTMNKLSGENEDFKKFVKDIKIDFESKRIHKSEYDEVVKDVEEYIRKKLK